MAQITLTVSPCLNITTFYYAVYPVEKRKINRLLYSNHSTDRYNLIPFNKSLANENIAWHNENDPFRKMKIV